MASSSFYNPPCAACKFLRRRCIPGCVFAPYFPPEDPQKFVNVHKIFGASNVTKLLNDVLPYQREDVISSLAYEAEARVRDPVYGCVGVITYLQRQVDRLQKDLDAANADLMRHVCNPMPVAPQQRRMDRFDARRISGVGGGGGYYQPLASVPYYYVNRTSNWKSYNSSRESMGGGGGGGGGGSGSGGGGGVGRI